MSSAKTPTASDFRLKPGSPLANAWKVFLGIGVLGLGGSIVGFFLDEATKKRFAFSYLYAFFAFWFFVGIVIALRIVRSPVGVIFSAIRDNPLRAAAVGHNVHGYKLTAFVIAAAYGGFAGGLLGNHPTVLRLVDQWGHRVTPLVFIGLGTYILVFR